MSKMPELPDYDSPMADDQILRWLIEFGSDWVTVYKLRNTWADLDIAWTTQVDKHELLEHNSVLPGFRLTQKAIDILQEK